MIQKRLSQMVVQTDKNLIFDFGSRGEIFGDTLLHMIFQKRGEKPKLIYLNFN